MVPFMTGQFRDSEAGKVFLNALDAGISKGEPAPPPPVAPAPPPERQINAASVEARQVVDTFTPAFRKATGSDGIQTWPLNSTYFATTETAQWVADKYGTGEVIEVPFGGVGGIYTASAKEYHIRLADGSLVNAGILAGYYERNPPDQFPGLADKLIRAQLGGAG